MSVPTALVKELREKSGAGVIECRDALAKYDCDIDKAMDFLRQKGREIAEKKKDRAVKEGIVEAYIHTGSKVGVLLELNCETDFVARNEEFRNLARELTLQIAAQAPKFISRDTVPEDIKKEQEDLYRRMALEENKPEHIVDKIVQGRMEKFYEENCLLDQPYIRDEEKKIKDLVDEAVGKIRENIAIRRFARFDVKEQ
ncbi:MAG: elongation factor Ts [Candidatus Eremiobacteraeota bacterium]|nr:elongation factor Ts [Candidatus Eremiobacteraeota bacterium]